MSNDGAGEKERKLTPFHQSCQEQCVFRSAGCGIKYAFINIYRRPPHRETRRIQVTNSAVRLEQVILKRRKSQFFCSTDQPGTISNQMQLKTIVLWKLIDPRIQCRNTICLKDAISVHEKQDRASGHLDPSVSRRRNSGMRLSNQRQRKKFAPAPNRIGGWFIASVVYDYDLKTGVVRKFR
jgi:hypothetical protein